jgi:hypothetical protein
VRNETPVFKVFGELQEIYFLLLLALVKTFLQKFLAMNTDTPIFALLKTENAALVKGLRRIPFTDESRVRFPYAVQHPLFQGVFLYQKTL